MRLAKRPSSARPWVRSTARTQTLLSIPGVWRHPAFAEKQRSSAARHAPSQDVCMPRPWRQGRGRGAVRSLAREHTTGQRAVRAVASAPRVPSPARPHNLNLAVVLLRTSGNHMPRPLAAAAAKSVGSSFRRSPHLLAQGRGRGVGQGLAREARARSCACHALVRVFACQAMNDPTASALPPGRSNAAADAAAASLPQAVPSARHSP